MLPVKGLDTHDRLIEECREPLEDLVAVFIGDGNKEHTVWVESNLDDLIKYNIITFLQENADVFTWSPINMPSIDPEMMMH